jgi:hypothetical protein
MKTNETLTTYTSPLTGTTYSVVESHSERGAWDAEGNYAPVVTAQYDIYDGSRWVQFALSPEGVAGAVAHYEQPGPDLGSRWD